MNKEQKEKVKKVFGGVYGYSSCKGKLLNNQLEFIENFGITSYYGKFTSIIPDDEWDLELKFLGRNYGFDHARIFKTEAGFVAIASPYNSHPASHIPFEVGFRPIAPLYHKAASTYCMTFTTTEEIMSFFKSLNSLVTS